MAVKGEQTAVTVSKQVQGDLVKAGLVENTAKCTWQPTKRIEWLGFIVDLSQGKLEVPVRKIEQLQQLLKTVRLNHDKLPAKMLASVIGKIISMSPALGTVARFMTRSLYSVLNSRHYWCDHLVLTTEAITEVQFWIDNLLSVNGENIWHSPSAVRLVYSDASSTGYGGYTVEHGPQLAHGMWSEEEAAKSSTWRELRGVRLVLESLASKLHNERLRWFTDNQNVARILVSGSKTPQLQAEALAVFSLCVKHT